MPSDSRNKSNKENKKLRQFYEEIYEKGEENYFSKFKEGVDLSETNKQIIDLFDWQKKSVLDVGCGTGALLREITRRGADSATGIDYSGKAIEIARKKHTATNARYISRYLRA